MRLNVVRIQQCFGWPRLLSTFLEAFPVFIEHVFASAVLGEEILANIGKEVEMAGDALCRARCGLLLNWFQGGLAQSRLPLMCFGRSLAHVLPFLTHPHRSPARLRPLLVGFRCSLFDIEKRAQYARSSGVVPDHAGSSSVGTLLAFEQFGDFARGLFY